MTEFPIPTAKSDPRGLTSGPDGAIWFTESLASRIGRLDPTGVFTEFSIPAADSQPNSQPIGIALGPDGNLWFTENVANNKIGRITPAGAITEFEVPTPGSQPYGIVSGSAGDLWFTEGNGNKIGRITTPGAITEFALPALHSQPASTAGGCRTAASGSPNTSEAGSGGSPRPARSPSSPSTAHAGPTGIAAGAGRKHLVHRARRQPDRAGHDGWRHHRIRDPDP